MAGWWALSFALDTFSKASVVVVLFGEGTVTSTFLGVLVHGFGWLTGSLCVEGRKREKRKKGNFLQRYHGVGGMGNLLLGRQ